MPPANDNFAGAVEIGGIVGQVNGNNIGATAQVNEPASNGKTVWFRFTPPISGTYFFSTRGTGGAALVQALRTVLRVYRGAIVSGLNESGYLVGAAWNQNYAGWDLGSYVAVGAAAGDVLMIRVDGAQGKPVRRTLERSRLGNVATVKSTAHGYATGLNVTIEGMASGYNGAGFIITVLDADHFTYPNLGPDEALVADVRGIITPNALFTQEGNFLLNWGIYSGLRLGACDGCPPAFGLGYTCVGTKQGGPMTQNFNLSFGNQPRGKYVMAYCGGAFIYIGSGFRWTVDLRTDPNFREDHAPWWNINYQVAGSLAHKTFSNLPNPPSFASQVDAEEGFRCMQAALDHDGGPISLDFFDFPLNDNIDSDTSNPTFGLYKLTPVFRVVSACASWVVQGTSASVALTFQNQTNADWGDVTATLQASGGISSPSAPQAGLTLAANSNRTLGFTFNTGTPLVTATLVLSSPSFPADIILSWYLGPIITRVNNTGPTDAGSLCAGRKVWVYTVSLQNTGYWNTPGTLQVSCTNGAAMVDNACNVITSFDYPPLICSVGQTNAAFRLRSTGFTAPFLINLTLKDGPISLATFTIPSAFPG